MAKLRGDGGWRARLVAAALLAALAACEQTPAKGDYHSREADLAIQELTLDFVRQVGTLCRQHTALRRGNFDLLAATPTTLLFSRTLDGDELVVAANRCAEAQTVAIPKPLSGTSRTELLSQTEVTFEGDNKEVSLPPFGLAIYQ